MSLEKRSIVQRVVRSLAKAALRPADYQRAVEERKAEHEWEVLGKRLKEENTLYELAHEVEVSNRELAIRLAHLAAKEGIDLTTRPQIQLIRAMADQEVRKIMENGLVELQKLRLGGDVDIEKIKAMGDLEILKGEAELQRRIQEFLETEKIKLKMKRQDTKLQMNSRLKAQEKLHELRERLRQNPAGDKP